MNIIRELRKRAGWQQKELAARVGVTVATVSDWETHKKDPSGKNLQKLAEIFDEDALVILGVVPPRDNTPGQENVPRTPEARILCAGIDQMPAEDRERALEVMRLVFAQYANYFDGTGENDDA